MLTCSLTFTQAEPKSLVADRDRVDGNAFRQQIVGRLLFEQGVAAGEQQNILRAPFQRLKQHFALVDPNSRPPAPHRCGLSRAR